MSLLGLVPDYGSDSSSSSDSDDEQNEQKGSNEDSNDNRPTGTATGKSQTEKEAPLPLPQLELSKPSTSKMNELNQRTLQTSSVFFNPYLAEEKKKLSVLEQHVQLSESKLEDNKHKLDKKKICFKFQKGKCRLGDRCKFSHGVVMKTGTSKPNAEATEPSFLPTFCSDETKYEPDEEEQSWEMKKKKRKAGVTDSLVPPKRAMAAYDRQQATERPWTKS